MLLSFAKREIA